MSEPGGPSGVPLTEWPEGVSVRVTALSRVDSPSTAHLVALGVVPGAMLTLVQRYPAFVVRIGHAEFALDQELAGRIHVS